MPPNRPDTVSAADCPHERGPGITVCLRCRADAYRRASGRQRALAARLGVGLVGTAVLVVAANGFLAARQQSGEGRPEVAEMRFGSEPPARTFTVAQAGAAPVRRAPASDVMPTLTVPAGRTDLGSGEFVERVGDSVTVHFDTPALRTRRRDKFEREVRRTLPVLLGPVADSALAAVPAGALAADGDLLTTLTARGVALPSRGKWALTVWPGIRPGHDGPLIVSYRVSVAGTR